MIAKLCPDPTVYRFVCPDGRSYVGSASGAYRRTTLRVHRKNPQLLKIFTTHPPETWRYEILEKLPSRCHAAELRAAEQRHIERLQTWSPEHGFNIRSASIAGISDEERIMRLSRRGGTLNWATSNKTAIPDKHPMEQKEFQSACLALGITNPGIAAELFGMSWRTCQRYWYAELDVPGPLARLIRVMVQQKISHAQMRKLSAPLSIRTPRQNAGTDL